MAILGKYSIIKCIPFRLHSQSNLRWSRFVWMRGSFPLEEVGLTYFFVYIMSKLWLRLISSVRLPLLNYAMTIFIWIQSSSIVIMNRDIEVIQRIGVTNNWCIVAWTTAEWFIFLSETLYWRLVERDSFVCSYLRRKLEKFKTICKKNFLWKICEIWSQRACSSFLTVHIIGLFVELVFVHIMKQSFGTTSLHLSYC